MAASANRRTPTPELLRCNAKVIRRDVRVRRAAVRADFVHFGDATGINPGQHVAVTQHRGSRRSLREPITKSLGWAVSNPKHPGRWSSGALVVRGVGRPGRWSSGALVVRGVGRPGRRSSGASDDRRRRAITASGNQGCRSIVRIRCSRAIVASNSSQCGPNGVGFGTDETSAFKGSWSSMIETG